MISFTLKGLLTRKLRTALTAVAIILGVATVSGTFVLTDSIDKAFNAIFTEVYRNTDATITPKSAFGSSDNGSTEAPFDQSLLAEVKALPDVQDAIGGVASDSTQLVKDGKTIAFGGAPNLGFSVDPTKPQFNSLTLVQGAWPGPNEVVVDKSTADKKDLDGRPDHRRAGRGPGREAHGSPASSSSGRSARSAARRSRASTSRPPSGSSTRRGSSTRSASPPSPESRPRSSSSRSARSCRRTRRCGPATPRRSEDAKSHGRVHLVPPLLPARLRTDRALRRRIRDRQLAVDHDRAAHARARDAADARRVATSGAGVGRARGARDGRPGIDRRAVPRARPREGPVRAVRRGRVHAAQQRHPARDADGRRVARRSGSSSR